MPPLIIPFFIPHAGCPHTCLFCNQRLIANTQEQIPSSSQVVDTVRQWLERSPNRQAEVAFYGGSFTLLPLEVQQELLEAVQPLIDQQLVSGIRISTRPDALGAETLAFLAGHQVRTIEIGVQSLDEQVLLLSGRGHTAADSLEAIQRVRQAGFLTGAQLLPGLPGDTEDKALTSLRRVIAAGAQFVRLYPALVLSGTALADEYRSGRYHPPDLTEGVRIAARLFHAAVASGVPVIRIGLQADDGLSADGAVLAGCWHPALGQLVKAQLFFDLVLYLVTSYGLTGTLNLYCDPSRISEVQGHKKGNLHLWQAVGVQVSTVLGDPTLLYHQVCIESVSETITGSYLTITPYKEITHA